MRRFHFITIISQNSPIHTHTQKKPNQTSKYHHEQKDLENKIGKWVVYSEHQHSFPSIITIPKF